MNSHIYVKSNILLKMTEFSVVLIEPKYEGNVGSVARLMKNFGFKDLVLVNPPQLDKSARAMAVHAKDVLDNALILDSFEKAAERFDFLVATTDEIATDSNCLRSPVFPEDLATALDAEGKVGLVFGREDSGMHNEEIAACDLIVSIPTSREYTAMNLSHSVAVILYELTRLKMREDSQKLNKFRKMGKLEKDKLLEKFDEFADLLYDNEYEARMAKKTFRQVTGRSFISGSESFTLMGLFRRSKNMIEHPEVYGRGGKKEKKEEE